MEQVRNYWKAHSSKDGEVLTASVRKASGKLRNRALNFLYLLECLVWTKRRNKIYPRKLLRILSTSNRMSQTSRKVDKNLLAWGVSQRLYATKCVTGLSGSLENTCASRRCTTTLVVLLLNRFGMKSRKPSSTHMATNFDDFVLIPCLRFLLKKKKLRFFPVVIEAEIFTYYLWLIR